MVHPLRIRVINGRYARGDKYYSDHADVFASILDECKIVSDELVNYTGIQLVEGILSYCKVVAYFAVDHKQVSLQSVAEVARKYDISIYKDTRLIGASASK